MDKYSISDSEDEDFLLGDDSGPVISHDLPIMKYKDQIIKTITDNQVTIIQGQTGCGKTTQIPQFLLDAGVNRNGMIGITQPRKIAVISLAKRVARERESAMGKEVGYEIRFYKKKGASTKIKYMTDGILLNECAQDKNLLNYNIIMIDEAHERSINTDVIMSLLKIVAEKRPELKIIIASATLNASKFSTYFNDAPILAIEGRLYPIDTIYTGYVKKYVEESARMVRKIHYSNEQGDILVFLTGEEEIEDCCQMLEDEENLVVKPLYGAMEFDEQQEVFEPVEEGKRKVVVATNIAETSITIPGLRFVIDCGYVKQSNFDSKRIIDSLEIVKISKAQAQQRRGRAGREAPGKCYRLYSEEMYEKLIDETIPEIFRKNLSEIFLKLVELKLNPKELKFIDPPSVEELDRCEIDLEDLSLMDVNNKLTSIPSQIPSLSLDSYTLTPIGAQVATLPVDPRLGKVMITSLSKHCCEDILKIISMLTENFIFLRPRKKLYEAIEKIKKFFDPDGDHFTFLNVFNEFSKNLQWPDDGETSHHERKKNRINYSKAKSWCRTNFVRFHSMKMVTKVYVQIRGMLRKMGKIDVNTGGRESIKECIISGYFKNICVNYFRESYTRFYKDGSFLIHPQSSLFDDSSIEESTKFVLFDKVLKTKKCYMIGVLRLDESTFSGFNREMKIINYPEVLEKIFDF